MASARRASCPTGGCLGARKPALSVRIGSTNAFNPPPEVHTRITPASKGPSEMNMTVCRKTARAVIGFSG
ncbi:hypothetical protein D3C72_1958620 [compost metagenome]